MEAQELRVKDTGELRAVLTELLKEQFSWRMQKGTGQLVTPHDLRRVRRDIARVRTVLGEKNRDQAAATQAAGEQEKGEAA
jgi:large subunit ribosomal protein L29